MVMVQHSPLASARGNDRSEAFFFGGGGRGGGGDGDRLRKAAPPFGQGEILICAQWRGTGAFVRTGVESVGAPDAFQADDEGSIPFTRSKA
jgi:hypothetical protein